MIKMNKITDWGNAPFIDYLNAVDDLLEDQLDVTTGDYEMVAEYQEAGATPEQCVEWIAANST